MQGTEVQPVARRAIVIVPRFRDIAPVQELRDRYDPLAGALPPHVTLVFPFASRLEPGVLRRHVEAAAAAQAPFRLVLKGVTGSEGGYLFLNVRAGGDQVADLHDALYGGVLSAHLDRRRTFVPHLTVGRIGDAEAFEVAIRDTAAVTQPIEAMAADLQVVRIDHGGYAVDLTVPLGAP